MSIKQKQKSLLRRAVRRGPASNLLEELERRVLLSVTWTGGGSDSKWSTGDNWSTHVAPAATDDVTINQTATITMDGTPVAKSLAVHGAAVVTLNFTTTNTLAVANNIDLQQTPSSTTSLVLQAQGTGVKGTVSSASLTINGPDKTGTSGLSVNANTTLAITGDLQTNGYEFNASFAGTVSATNAFFNGKDLPASGPGEVSTVMLTGLLTVSKEMRIGGNGITHFTLDHGDAELGLGTQVGVFDGSQLVLTGQDPANRAIGRMTADTFTVGDQAKWLKFTPVAALANQSGAEVQVHQGALLNTGRTSIAGGQSIQVTVDTQSSMLVFQNLWIGPAGVANQPGPSVTASGAPTGTIAGTISVQKDIILVNTGSNASGQLTVKDNASVHGHRLIVWSKVKDPFDVLVTSGGILDADWVLMDGTLGTPGVIGHASVFCDGGTLRVSVLTIPLLPAERVLVGGPNINALLDVGGPGGGVAGSGFPYTLPALIGKYDNGDVTGTGGTTGAGINDHRILSARRIFGADLLPGDYFSGHDDDGQLILNGSPEFPLATMTVTGELLDDGALVLDSVLGTPGDANKLYVTGEAYISGDLDIYVASGVSSTSYAAGDSFTLLTADGGLFGQFTNLPAGYYNNFFQPTLPALNSGLVWEVEYTGSSPADGDPANSVLLKVRQRPVIPTSEYATTDDITPSGSRINVGGGYADVTAAIYSTATVSMGALASGLAIAWNGDHSFGDYIDYYDSPTGGSSLELGGQFQVIVQYREAQPNYRFPTLHRVRLAA